MEYVAFDAHKRYTLAAVVRPDGRLVREQRIAHERGALREFLERCAQGSPVAVETIGNWYGIVDEIEAARAGARRLATSVGCMNASRCKGHAKAIGRWPGIWPKRRIGC